ncbi:Pseudouridine-5'-phosphatase [Cladochytrium tenue]|nr:Pseudouridine-5'-phosphatase [Cladochytrium tenue]
MPPSTTNAANADTNAPATAAIALFDMDGLLLDTERVYSEVTQDILSRFGCTFEWSVKSRMMGLHERDAAQILIDHYRIPLTVDQYLVERNAGHVATSSHRKAFALKTSNNGALFTLFDTVLCADDDATMRSKPAPDIFLAARVAVLASGVQVRDPSAPCVVFEDSPAGVRAGLAAGMRVVWVPDANLAVDPDLAAQCAAVVNSLDLLAPESVGFPPY